MGRRIAANSTFFITKVFIRWSMSASTVRIALDCSYRYHLFVSGSAVRKLFQGLNFSKNGLFSALDPQERFRPKMASRLNNVLVCYTLTSVSQSKSQAELAKPIQFEAYRCFS
jgi:hypothetical protein